MKNLVNENGFSLTNFEKSTINGIEMLSISSFKNIKDFPIELYVTYFSNQHYQFGIFLTVNQLDAVAKMDYEKIINSIRFKENQGAEKLKNNFCTNCGAPVNPDGKFCGNCGFKLYD